jgi:predicted Zn-ribbon and HTH transcriptional regulator
VGLFGQIASVCKNILESELKIHSIQDLFEHLIILPFNKNISSATTKNLWNLWKESFNQLDPNLQELFLYRIKLFLERQIEEKVKSFSEYERLRFRFRHDVHVIVIEEQCKQCNFITIKDFDILTYLDKLNLSPYEPLVASKCPKCKELMLRRS